MAPSTASPTETSTGTGSPVSSERSTADAPSTTTPSVAIFSPGPHDEEVAGLELRNRNAHLGAVPEDRCIARTELEQAANRL